MSGGIEEAPGVAEPVFNTVQYYNAFSLLRADAPLSRDTAEALLFQPQIGLQGSSGESRAGAFIPAECFESQESLKQYVSEVGSRPHPVFLTATDDVLVSHPIEANVSVFKALRHVEWGVNLTSFRKNPSEEHSILAVRSSTLTAYCSEGSTRFRLAFKEFTYG